MSGFGQISKRLRNCSSKTYYTSISHLDHDLEKALPNDGFETLPGQRKGKNRRYPIGTTVQLKAKGKTFYLIAIAEMNQYGNAFSTFENVKICLAKIWDYIGSRGDLQPIVIPLIGSGRARLTQTRDEIAREIIKSVIAACSNKKFCEKLTIAISPSDYGRLNFRELGEYLSFICNNTEFRDRGDTGQGTAIQ